MQLSRADSEGRQHISSYGNGKFRVFAKDWFGPILVTPEETFAWTCTDITQLTAEDLQPVFDHDPDIEILVIGCGDKNMLIPAKLKQLARDHGVTIDHMDTGAAVRTYTILNTDARRAAAALIPVQDK